MTIGYTKRGLDAWQRAVPLQLALPPTQPWTCLLERFGLGLAFRAEGWSGAVMSEYLLRGLLERAGHTGVQGMSRALMLVTPIPRTDLSLADEVGALLGDPMLEEHAARALAMIGGPHALHRLVEHAGAKEDTSSAVIDAWGHLGGPPGYLLKWDGTWDAERLRALVRAGHLPEELPTGLESLASMFPTLDPDGVREALESLDGMDTAAAEAVALALRAHPEVAVAVADVLGDHLVRSIDLPVWADVIGLAARQPDGEDLLDATIEKLKAEDWRDRMGAAMALGITGSERAMDGLRACLQDDDPDVRREAALALSRLGQPQALTGWTERYDFMERARSHPWGAALTGGDIPRSMFALLARRDAPELLERAAFAVALAWPDEAAPALEGMAKDGGFEIPLAARQAAAAALLLTGHAPSDRGDLFRILLRDLEDQGMSGPLDGLSEGTLVALLAKDGDWQVRLAALGLLGRLGAAPRHDALLALLIETDTDSDVRNRAASLRAPRWRSRGLPDSLAAVVHGSRMDSARRATGLKELEAIDPLLAGELSAALLDHTDREVAVLAARLVGRTATEASRPGHIAWALATLRFPDWIRREVAAALLGSLDPTALDPAIREELMEILEAVGADDDDRDVQRMATWAAARLESGT